MSSFRVLIDEHDELVVLARKLLATINRGSAMAAHAFQIRGTLSEKLSGHFEFAEANIYQQLMTCDDGAASTVAAEFCESSQFLAQDWMIYLARWPIDAATANWTNFCQATRAIVGRLLRRITEENTRLYPAALRAAVIALR